MKNFSGVCQAAGADKPLRAFFIWITNIVTLSNKRPRPTAMLWPRLFVTSTRLHTALLNCKENRQKWGTIKEKIPLRLLWEGFQRCGRGWTFFLVSLLIINLLQKVQSEVVANTICNANVRQSLWKCKCASGEEHPSLLLTIVSVNFNETLAGVVSQDTYPLFITGGATYFFNFFRNYLHQIDLIDYLL